MKIFEQPLRDINTWMAASDSNYGMYFVIVGVLIVLGIIGLYVAGTRIGKRDERTERIHSGVYFDMLIVLGISSTIFVSSLATGLEYTEQLYLIVFAITIISGAVSGFVRNHLSLR